MTKETKPVLTDLLSVSRRLAESASSGEWEVVSELKARQQELVETFFECNGGGPLSAHVLSELTQVRVFTDLVLELAKKRRTGLIDAGRKVATGRNAAAAYANESRPARQASHSAAR
ncbi:MAG: hypothetical protein AB8G17_17630 [Gammaproteobacteria bacterium]